jgi:hypothetical protein
MILYYSLTYLFQVKRSLSLKFAHAYTTLCLIFIN